MYEDAFCVSPNAWGGVLNKETIPNIKAKVVCGACNNQLQFASDAQLLMQVRACCARMPLGPSVFLCEFRTSHFTRHFFHSAVWPMYPTSCATAWALSIAAWRCIMCFRMPSCRSSPVMRFARCTATSPAIPCSSSTSTGPTLTLYPAP